MIHLLHTSSAWASDGSVRITDVATWGVLVVLALAVAAGARLLQRWVTGRLEPMMRSVHEAQQRPARLLPWDLAPALDELLPGRLHHHQAGPEGLPALVSSLLEAGYCVAVSGPALLDVELTAQAGLFRAPDGADPALLTRLVQHGQAALILEAAPERDLKTQAEQLGVALIVLDAGAPPRGAHPWGPA